MPCPLPPPQYIIALLNSQDGYIQVSLVAGIHLVFQTLYSPCVFSVSHVVMWYIAKG